MTSVLKEKNDTIAQDEEDGGDDDDAVGHPKALS